MKIDKRTDQAREMFPPLVQVAGAIYHRNAARVDGRLLTRAVISAAEAQGLQVAHRNVDRLLIDHGKVLGVKVADESVTAAPRVVIASGAWYVRFPQLLANRQLREGCEDSLFGLVAEYWTRLRP